MEGRGEYDAKRRAESRAPSGKSGRRRPDAFRGGMANEISHHLKRLDIPPKVNRFLRHLEDETWGEAGVHARRKREHAGLWCDFVLSEWVRETGLEKTQLCHIRSRLVTDGVVWYESDPCVPGTGRIGWQTDFSLWKPLQPDYRTWGGARSGAGRPKQSVVVNLNSHDDHAGVVILNNSEQSSVVNLNSKKNSSLQRNISRLQRTHVSNADGNGADGVSLIIPTVYEESSPTEMSEEMVTNVTTRSATRADVSGAQNNQNDTITLTPFQGDVERNPTPVSPPPPRKRAARQLSADHAWRVELNDRVAHLRNGGVYNKGRDWKAAGELYKLGADIDDLVELWELEMQRPKRQSGEELTIFDIAKCYGTWHKSHDNYRAGVERSIKGMRGEYESKSASRAAPVTPKTPSFKRATSPWDVSPAT